jgi:hypothetical protein
LDIHKFLGGRRYAKDERDAQYPLRAAIPHSTLTRKTWFTGKPLDQGSTPQCVAYSGTKWLTSAPVRNKKKWDITWLYKECQKNDEWPGEDYDGTSVRGLFKTLQQQGYVSEYRWATDVTTMANHILTVGPLVVGTNWYENMFDIDASGFLNVSGALAGGHAWLLKGVSLVKKCPDGSKGAFRMINSWGITWGQKGMAWVSFKDMTRLIAEEGEACTATEIKKV